jgi:uncharacterized membrane protein (Fun14 family)
MNNDSSRYVIQYGIAAYRYGGNMMSSCSSAKRTSPLGMVISFSRGGNHHHNNYHQYTSFNPQQKQQRVLLNMALFSTALYSTSIGTPNTSFCSNNNSSNNNDDEDFITKIKSKIDSSTLPTTLLDNLSNNQQLRSTLSTLQQSLQTIFDTGIPTQLSYGFIAGYLSGYTLKKIGRVASLTFGVGFVMLQVMAYNGYIDVNHERLRKEVEGILDRNGDGKVDTEDLERVVEEVKKVVGFGLLDDSDNEEESDKEEEGGEGGKKIKAKAVAGGGGFGLGFLGGLRSG